MSLVEVTNHALLRYQERIERVSLREARRRIMLHAPMIERAAAFGCRTVLLPNRAKLALQGLRVVTIYPPEPHRSPRCGRTIDNGRRRLNGRDKWGGFDDE